MTSRLAIEEYYATLVQLVASQMVDPHRYFEQKLTGEMRVAQSEDARRRLLAQLLAWLDEGLLTPAQRERVDARLLESGLPSTCAAGLAADALQVRDDG
jgi:hypothetical protein